MEVVTKLNLIHSAGLFSGCKSRVIAYNKRNMATKAKRKGNPVKASQSQARGRTSPSSVTPNARVNIKKNIQQVSDRSGQKTIHSIKAIVLICVALISFAYMIYSGGSTGGFVLLVIGLVCGLLGVLFLREGKKGG